MQMMKFLCAFQYREAASGPQAGMFHKNLPGFFVEKIKPWLPLHFIRGPARIIAAHHRVSHYTYPVLKPVNAVLTEKEGSYED